MNRPKVVIIGGGFGGLTAAKKLGNKNCEVILIDKTNHHLFQPLLYQVATAALSPGDIAVPLRAILNNYKNIEVLMGEVLSVDVENNKVILKDSEIEFNYLIVAPGSSHSYFGKTEWEKFAPGLKTVKDALHLREKMLLAFEKAERYAETEDISKYMTFVIVGAGPTGVEMAGAIAEITKRNIVRDFRNINPADAKIYLIEGSDRVLVAYDEKLSRKAEADLEKMGVSVILGNHVTEVTADGVRYGDNFIQTENIIWAAGNAVNGLTKSLNTELDRAGRVIVENDCSLKEHRNIFIIGDAAFLKDKKNKPLPGIAPVAIQQAKYVSKLILTQTPKEERKPFHYFNKGTMATIGRAKAVAEFSAFGISGLVAWLLWSFIHIMYLIGFRNRYMVMSEWIWNYVTNKSEIRLITNTKI